MGIEHHAIQLHNCIASGYNKVHFSCIVLFHWVRNKYTSAVYFHCIRLEPGIFQLHSCFVLGQNLTHFSCIVKLYRVRTPCISPLSVYYNAYQLYTGFVDFAGKDEAHAIHPSLSLSISRRSGSRTDAPSGGSASATWSR